MVEISYICDGWMWFVKMGKVGKVGYVHKAVCMCESFSKGVTAKGMDFGVVE